MSDHEQKPLPRQPILMAARGLRCDDTAYMGGVGEGATRRETEGEMNDKTPPAIWSNPDWSPGGRVHNWKNHVPDKVRVIWDTFTEEQKNALYEWAEACSDAEEWE